MVLLLVFDLVLFRCGFCFLFVDLPGFVCLTLCLLVLFGC